jgi:drug/metabolite transporter (DMT)-like permease
MKLKWILLTLLAMMAFAGNSLLCRLALKETGIDPTLFFATRLVSGALMLWLMMRLRAESSALEGSWRAALALFVYASGFAYAYVQIPAGTGALLLFASIQITMILYGLIKGDRLSQIQWLGVILALGGLIALMLPRVESPPLSSALLMIGAGVAWGVYSLLGRGARNPSAATAGNFIRSVPLALVALLAAFALGSIRVDNLGLLYALASGVITSGLGYVLWYAVLKHLNVTQAATVQLSVPVITAFAGALLLAEAITSLLVFSTMAILLGVSMVIFSRAKR